MASNLKAVWQKRQAETAGGRRMPKAPAGASPLDELHLDIIKGGSADSISGELFSIICAPTFLFCDTLSCTV